MEGFGPRPEVTVRTASLTGARFLPRPWREKYVHWRRTRTLAAVVESTDLVVIGCDNGPLLTDAVRIATELGKPLCCIVHADLEGKFALPRYRGWWSKGQTLALLRRVDKIVGVSLGLRDDLARDLPERANDILAIPNGVDLARLDRMSAASDPTDRLPSDRPFFLGLGRLAHQKGFDILLRAHALALRQGAPEHAVVLVGEGHLRGELEQLADQLGIGDTVVFHGFAENPFPVMARATALCLPSRYEGYSFAVAEAAALGVPVIAFDCPHGPAEILENGRYGELLPPEDAEGLAAAMLAHLTDALPLREKAAASFQARDRLSAERRYGAYAALFDALLRRRGRIIRSAG